jgi:hypothetical protein
MYCKIYINYRGVRQIAWIMFQTLLCRSALAAVFSNAVWVRDKKSLQVRVAGLAVRRMRRARASYGSRQLFPTSTGERFFIAEIWVDVYSDIGTSAWPFEGPIGR